MKGDVSDHRLLTRDVRPHSSYVSSSSADYLITTMKLREHVLASKPKKPGSSNKLIRNMRSAPPFQNRNLDNFPMPYNREDAVRSARGQRADKRNNAVRMTRWRAESGLMKEYSKQMFDFSVHSAKTSATLNGTKISEEKGDVATRSKSETDYYAALRTNGPTPDGSALHNRRQKVLNSIRIRPHTECQTQFKHERSTSSSNVEHAISDKNRRYRVQSVTESSTRPGSHYGNISLAGSEFIFIPVDESSMVNGWVSDERVTNRRITFDNSLSESNDTDSLDATFGKDPFDDFEDKNNEVNVGNTTRQDQQNCQSTFSPYPRKLLPPSTSSNIRLVSLDEASASESEDEKVEPVEEVKKPEPPPPPPPEKPKSKTRGKKGGKKPAKQKATKVVIVEEEKKVPEPEPEPEPVKVKLILKGPHCWVDDATVTSEPSDLGDFDHPDGANPTSGEQLETNAERQNSAQKLDTTAKTKSLMKDAISANTKPTLGTILKQPNQQSVKDAFDKALQKNVQSPTNANGACDDLNKQLLDSRGVENNLVEVDAEKQSAEEEGDNIILPPFLCPSSEKKSRQAALKDWLACSAFRNAHNGIPIV